MQCLCYNHLNSQLQVEENMKAINVIPLLTPEVMNKIEAIVQTKPKCPESYRWMVDIARYDVKDRDWRLMHILSICSHYWGYYISAEMDMSTYSEMVFTFLLSAKDLWYILLSGDPALVYVWVNILIFCYALSTSLPVPSHVSTDIERKHNIVHPFVIYSEASVCYTVVYVHEVPMHLPSSLLLYPKTVW